VTGTFGCLSPKAKMEINGKEKVRVLLNILGPEVTTLVLEYLPEDVAKELSVSLSKMPPPTPEIVHIVLKEMQSMFLEGSSPKRKAIESKDFTEEAKSVRVETNITEEKEEIKGQDITKAEKIIQILRGETDQTVAFVLSNLDKKLRDEVYFNLASDIVERVNKINVDSIPISAKAFNSIEKILIQ